MPSLTKSTGIRLGITLPPIPFVVSISRFLSLKFTRKLTLAATGRLLSKYATGFEMKVVETVIHNISIQKGRTTNYD
jgi:hypothetical protein